MKKIYSKIETLNFIHEQMDKIQMSNEDLSKILGISCSAVSRKLNGNRDFSIQELITIADVFEMDLLQLIKYNRKVK